MLLYTTTYYIIQLSSFTRGEMKWVGGFRVQGSGFRVQGSGFRVQGCGGGFAANIYGAMPEGLRVAGFPRIASLPRVGKAAIREYRFPHNVKANTRICGKRITTDKAFPTRGRLCFGIAVFTKYGKPVNLLTYEDTHRVLSPRSHRTRRWMERSRQ